MGPGGKTEITIVANKKQEKRNVVLVIFSFKNRLHKIIFIEEIMCLRDTKTDRQRDREREGVLTDCCGSDDVTVIIS